MNTITPEDIAKAAVKLYDTMVFQEPYRDDVGITSVFNQDRKKGLEKFGLLMDKRRETQRRDEKEARNKTEQSDI